VEVLLALLDRLAQRLVVRLAADRALHLVGRVAGRRGPAAEEVAGRAQKRAGRAQSRCLIARHEAVAALVTVELELVAAIRGQVFVVADELNHRHLRNPRKSDE
jgi:hypothetical protein